MNNLQNVRHKIEEMLAIAEDILDFNHVRLQQGDIEIDLFVMSRLTNPHAPRSSSDISDAEINLSHEAHHDAKYRAMIREAIQQIFWYRRFHKNDVMASSPLHELMAVQQACQAWMRERDFVLGSLSEQDKATVLRKFLVCCLDKNLCPTPGKAVPEKLESSELRNEWLEYLILRWQYVDAQSREQIIQELAQNHCFITGGSTYTRRLHAARERLAGIVYQKEMQARQARRQRG